MTAFILNPKSGSVTALDEVLAGIKGTFPGARVFIGEAAGDAQRDAAAAVDAGFGTVIAAGGDGTLNDVLNAIMPHSAKVRLGLLPLGTGNDFARTLEMPADLSAALEVLRAGQTRAVDVVQATSGKTRRHFLNASAGGFSGVVNEKLTDEVKAAWGPLSYIRGMIEALPELSPYACRLILDDEPPFELSCFNLVVANGRALAKGIPIAPEADPTDGWLDLVAIRETSGARLALLVPLVLAGRHLESDDVLFRRARRIAIHAAPSMAFNTDGETFGDTPLVFEVQPRAVEMIAPALV